MNQYYQMLYDEKKINLPKVLQAIEKNCSDFKCYKCEHSAFSIVHETEVSSAGTERWFLVGKFFCSDHLCTYEALKYIPGRSGSPFDTFSIPLVCSEYVEKGTGDEESKTLTRVADLIAQG